MSERFFLLLVLGLCGMVIGRADAPHLPPLIGLAVDIGCLWSGCFFLCSALDQGRCDVKVWLHRRTVAVRRRLRTHGYNA